MHLPLRAIFSTMPVSACFQNNSAILYVNHSPIPKRIMAVPITHREDGGQVEHDAQEDVLRENSGADGLGGHLQEEGEDADDPLFEGIWRWVV